MFYWPTSFLWPKSKHRTDLEAVTPTRRSHHSQECLCTLVSGGFFLQSFCDKWMNDIPKLMVEHLYVKSGDRYLRYLVKNRQREVKNHLHPPAAVSVCNRGKTQLSCYLFLINKIIPVLRDAAALTIVFDTIIENQFCHQNVAHWFPTFLSLLVIYTTSFPFHDCLTQKMHSK